MSTIRPDKDGDPLPKGTLVFRIGKDAQPSPATLEKRKASPAMFELSSEDKKCAVPRLSIWVEELTIADQAWDFMGSKPECNIVACLTVDEIHEIPTQPGFRPLRAEWEQALTDDGSGHKVPNNRPGAEGHCGIAGLDQGGNGNIDKNKRKALRSALADNAEISPVPVPHDIDLDQIQVAAYFLFEKEGSMHSSPEVHWIKAIRQLRRARVQQGKQRNMQTNVDES